jgi:hypothetical protein
MPTHHVNASMSAGETFSELHLSQLGGSVQDQTPGSPIRRYFSLHLLGPEKYSRQLALLGFVPQVY